MVTRKSGDDDDWLTGPRRDVSRERILAAAVELVRKRGFDNVTPEDVASRAGCSRATLYRHMWGKDAIRDAVILHLGTSIAQRVTEAGAGLEGAKRVTEVVLAAAATVRAQPAVREALSHTGNDLVVRFMSSPEILALALNAAGLDASDALAGHAIVRITWSLVQYPLEDPERDRQFVERFVEPNFR